MLLIVGLFNCNSVDLCIIVGILFCFIVTILLCGLLVCVCDNCGFGVCLFVLVFGDWYYDLLFFGFELGLLFCLLARWLFLFDLVWFCFVWILCDFVCLFWVGWVGFVLWWFAMFVWVVGCSLCFFLFVLIVVFDLIVLRWFGCDLSLGFADTLRFVCWLIFG